MLRGSGEALQPQETKGEGEDGEAAEASPTERSYFEVENAKFGASQWPSSQEELRGRGLYLKETDRLACLLAECSRHLGFRLKPL